jgi:hypothetical protein
VALSRPIKELGLHTVHVNLHPEVDVDIVLNVARSSEEAELQASGKSIQELAAEEEAAAEFEIAELFDDIGAAQLDDLDDGAAPAESTRSRGSRRGQTRKTDLRDPPGHAIANRWAVSLAGMRPIFFLRTPRSPRTPCQTVPCSSPPVCRCTLTAPAVLAQPVSDGEPNRPDIRPAFAEQTEAPERVSSFVAEPGLSPAALSTHGPWRSCPMARASS